MTCKQVFNQAALSRSCRGFTLVEMVIVIILVGIIAALGSKMLASGFSSYLTSKDLSQAEWQGYIAMERITRELRDIRSATPADLTLSPTSQISFIDTDANAISYSLSGTTLMRNSQPLADGISNLNFAYIMSDGKTTAATAAQVHYIVVSLSVLRQGASQTLRATIHPGNFL